MTAAPTSQMATTRMPIAAHRRRSFTSESLDTLRSVLAANYRSGTTSSSSSSATASSSRRATSRSVIAAPCASSSSARTTWTSRRPATSSSLGGRTDRGSQKGWGSTSSALGARVASERGVARLLAAQARVPRRLARPPGEGRPPRRLVDRRHGRLRLRRASGRPHAARARSVPSWSELQYRG